MLLENVVRCFCLLLDDGRQGRLTYQYSSRPNCVRFFLLDHTSRGVCIRSHRTKGTVLVAPEIPYCVWCFVVPWGRIARKELERHYRLKLQMALAQTMGGGWASVKNVCMASKWALRLFEVAEQLGDASSLRKCRIYVGWAHLWQGDTSTSTKIFLRESDESLSTNDTVNYGRCTAGLSYAATFS